MPRKVNNNKKSAEDPAQKSAIQEENSAQTQPAIQERSVPPNHIYIGKKPVMSYAMSALIQLTQMEDIIIKARGLAISRAVDVAQVVTKRLGNGAFSIKNIHIDTEVVGEGGETRNVSSIEIAIGK
jgi:DNA-binding protein